MIFIENQFTIFVVYQCQEDTKQYYASRLLPEPVPVQAIVPSTDRKPHAVFAKGRAVVDAMLPKDGVQEPLSATYKQSPLFAPLRIHITSLLLLPRQQAPDKIDGDMRLKHEGTVSHPEGPDESKAEEVEDPVVPLSGELRTQHMRRFRNWSIQ